MNYLALGKIKKKKKNKESNVWEEDEYSNEMGRSTICPLGTVTNIIYGNNVMNEKEREIEEGWVGMIGANRPSMSRKGCKVAKIKKEKLIGFHRCRKW